MTLKTTTEIVAPPSVVRATFLDFASFPTWHKGFFRQVKIYDAVPNPDGTPKKPSQLSPGDRLHNILGDDGMAFYPTITVNNETEFRWYGKAWRLPGVLTAEHWFRFEESKAEGNVNGTTFVQEETFGGILAFLMKEGSSMHTASKQGFEGFGADLKAKCEKVETK